MKREVHVSNLLLVLHVLVSSGCCGQDMSVFLLSRNNVALSMGLKMGFEESDVQKKNRCLQHLVHHQLLLRLKRIVRLHKCYHDSLSHHKTVWNSYYQCKYRHCFHSSTRYSQC